MIRFSCSCGKVLQARDEDVGKNAQCPTCRRLMIVPTDAPLRPRGSPGEPDEDEPPPGPRSLREARSGKATAALVLGILTPFLCGLPSIPAFVFGILALRDIALTDGRLAGKGRALGGIAAACLGLIVTIVVGISVFMHLDSWREGRRLAQDEANLKTLGQGLIAFAEAHQNRLPQATAFRTPTGRPALSWRVAILPYIGEEALYRQFHLDEEWDSAHNRSLIARMPKVFLLPGQPDDGSGRTWYQVFVGPGSLFELKKDPKKLAPSRSGQPLLGLRWPTDVPDGVQKTLLIATARTGVVWTLPDDLEYEGRGLLPPLGGHLSKGYQVVFADGTVKLLPQTTSLETLRAMISRNGGDTFTMP